MRHQLRQILLIGLTKRDRIDMPATFRQFLAVAALMPLMLVASDAFAQGGGASAMEIAQLPRFCWGSLQVPNAVGPEFNFPPQTQCGPAMNHYCPGLIQLIRAKHASKKADRFSNLWQADANIRYTENAIKDYPNCPVRDHIAASRADVNNLMTVYGFKGPRAK
jgi:hypothetical protein